MDEGQAYLTPPFVDDVMLPGAASPDELAGQIDGLIADLQRLKGEIPSLRGWMSEPPLFLETSHA
jgi:hypothetical protein